VYYEEDIVGIGACRFVGRGTDCDTITGNRIQDENGNNLAAVCSPPVRVRVPAGETTDGGQTNQPPVANAQNVVAPADANCQAQVTPQQVNNGSFDPEGGAVTLSLNPPGPYPKGMTPVSLIVVDDQGQSNSAPATVTVMDLTAPMMICPDDIVRTAPLGQGSVIVDYTEPAATAFACS